MGLQDAKSGVKLLAISICPNAMNRLTALPTHTWANTIIRYRIQVHGHVSSQAEAAERHLMKSTVKPE